MLGVNQSFDGQPSFWLCSIVAHMIHADKLTPASTDDLVVGLAFALRFHGRKPIHNADEFMAEIVAKRLVEQLEHGGLVV